MQQIKQISLKSARVNAELTQAEAAQKIGVSKDALSKWERGLAVPNARHIQAIEAAYDIPYDMLKFFCA